MISRETVSHADDRTRDDQVIIFLFALVLLKGTTHVYEYWKEVEQNEDQRWMRDNSNRINSKTGVKEKLRG